MDSNFQSKECSDNDVLEFSSGAYRIKKIIELVSKTFNNILSQQLYELLKKESVNIFPGYHSITQKIIPSNYFTDGVDCEILKVGSDSWQKGKFKLSVFIEFIPDEPEKSESELDTVRQELNN